MKKFYIVLIFLIISSLNSNAHQYILQPAFPNLPTFLNPTELVNAGDGSNRLFLLQQNGLIYVFQNTPEVSVRKVFLNLQSKVTQGGSETGLLGMAFHPDFENNGYLYVSYTFDSTGNPSRTWSRIARYNVSPDNPDSVIPATEFIILTISQPDLTHKAGKILFGPEGYMYLSFGDGGGDGDPLNQAQNKFSMLGKILRINVDSAGGGRNYSIPSSNPFYGTGFREEIYAFGFRNTWKFCYDYPTNRIIGGDVGQERFEEINLIESGKNYGWNKVEGNHCYPDSNNCDTAGKGFTKPLLEYRHNVDGNSITGGYVYRGSEHPDLYGKYIYGDYVFGKIWAMDFHGSDSVSTQLLQDTNFFISSFGEDEAHELYVLRHITLQSRIYKFVDFGISTLDIEAAIEGFYDTTNARLSIRDTISVYLRSTVAPYNLVDSAKTVIDSLTFKGRCVFHNAPSDKYYIQLKHRNTIEVWSEISDSIKRGYTASYDFTNDSAKIYGSNSIIVGSKYCIPSGDVDIPGIIDLNDIIKIFNDVSAFATGYVVSDVTGSGTVDLNDLITVYNNAGKFIVVKKPLP